MQRIGMIWLKRQDLLVNRLRFGHPARVVVRDRLLEQLRKMIG